VASNDTPRGQAKSDAKQTPVKPGVLARLVQGVRYTLAGVVPSDWFGPGQPLQPQAQTQAVGRAYDFDVNTNMQFTPRGDEPVSFEQMRALADPGSGGFDLLRLVIQTRKDQICSQDWTITPSDPEAERTPQCDEIQKFLEYPDQEHDWETWLRMLLEDLLVIDAPTIYPRMNRGGGLYGLELVDGALIKRVIDSTGRTPLPPDPAYQQVIKGMPAVDYSRDQLIYVPQNPRTNRVYGYSPVEQIITTVNIALRRQTFQLQYYSEGNVPEMLIQVPETWQPDQIKQVQNWFDNMLEGNTAQRRHAKFIPGGGKMGIHETKNAALKDDYDEWLARIVCFAFSIAPTPFIKQMNRSTGDTSADAAKDEGLIPLMSWTARTMTRVIQRYFVAPDLRFDWVKEADNDPLIAAQVAQIYVTAKVLTPDEVREDLGREPLTAEQQELLNPPPPPGLDGPQVDENGKPVKTAPDANAPGGKQPAGGRNGQGDAAKRAKKKLSRRSIAIGRRSPSRVLNSHRY
jgi:Phage portal protein